MTKLDGGATQLPPFTLTNCEIVENSCEDRIRPTRRTHQIPPDGSTPSLSQYLDNFMVARQTCSPRRITFTTQTLTLLPGSTRSGPLCRSRLRAGKYSNAKLHSCREKGEAADISFDRGESWRQRKGGSISWVCSYGEEGSLFGSSLISSIQAVPIILLSNFIDGCRIT